MLRNKDSRDFHKNTVHQIIFVHPGICLYSVDKYLFARQVPLQSLLKASYLLDFRFQAGQMQGVLPHVS